MLRKIILYHHLSCNFIAQGTYVLFTRRCVQMKVNTTRLPPSTSNRRTSQVDEMFTAPLAWTFHDDDDMNDEAVTMSQIVDYQNDTAIFDDIPPVSLLSMHFASSSQISQTLLHNLTQHMSRLWAPKYCQERQTHRKFVILKCHVHKDFHLWYHG